MGADGDRLEGGVGGVGRAREEGEGEGRVSVNGDGGSFCSYNSLFIHFLAKFICPSFYG